MKSYGITFKNSGDTIQMQAEYYDIRDGFVNLYKAEQSTGLMEAFAFYAADNVRGIAEQKEFTEEETMGDLDKESMK